ncbi:MAG: FHA domain-containing protein [Wenzhouxiangella sp.]
MTFRLKAASGPRTGEAFELDDDTRIGSGPSSQIRLDGIADEHARIRFDGDRLTLEASAETHVNGDPVTSRALKSGDEIRLGPNRFVLQAPGLRPPSVLSETERRGLSPWAWVAIGAAAAASGLAALYVLVGGM